MAQVKTKIRLSVGRQNLSRAAYRHEVAYINDVREQFKVISDNFEKLVNGLSSQSPEVLLEALEPTFELSQTYVPYDTGALYNSGFLEVDKSSKYPRVIMGYAKGGVPDYAAKVHETMEVYHEPPTRAKFLSSALQEDAAGIQERIINAYKFIAGT